jgi:hypothetical protein
MSRNKVTQNSIQQEQSEKDDQENLSGFIVSAEIHEYWKLMTQLDWPKISPEGVRDSPFCKTVCTSNVVWFLLSQTYFPKNKLFSVAENIQDQVGQNFAAKNQKSFVRFMSFLAEMRNCGHVQSTKNFCNQLKLKVS